MFFYQIKEALFEDANLGAQARVNKIDTFQYAFDDKFLDSLINRMDQNRDVFEKIVSDELFGGIVREAIIKNLYKRFNQGL